MVTTIGIDPHKATHTAVAINGSETVLGEITIPADRDQTKRLIDWAQNFDGDGRVWAVEAAGGLLPVGSTVYVINDAATDAMSSKKPGFC